jgi:hypothetical protein
MAPFLLTFLYYLYLCPVVKYLDIYLDIIIYSSHYMGISPLRTAKRTTSPKGSQPNLPSSRASIPAVPPLMLAKLFMARVL